MYAMFVLHSVASNSNQKKTRKIPKKNNMNELKKIFFTAFFLAKIPLRKKKYHELVPNPGYICIYSGDR